MKTVHKFGLQNTDFQTISVPVGGQILFLAVQNETACLWIEVESSAPKVERQFVIYGTGHQIVRTNLKYIGSYMLLAGAFVGHVYEESPS